VSRALASLLVVCAACGPGARRASSPNDVDPNVRVACVLVAEGAICTFTADRTPGSRCVKVLYGVVTGTVSASEQICSGRLETNESSTMVARFTTRPADACGKTLGDCLVKTVDPKGALDSAAAWQQEIKQTYKGPVTESECRNVITHKYDVWMHADCDADTDPVQRQQCYHDMNAERDQDLPVQVQDCVGSYSRERLGCELDAKTSEALSSCEDRYYEGGGDGP
jgi:hypothetical protein